MGVEDELELMKTLTKDTESVEIEWKSSSNREDDIGGENLDVGSLLETLDGINLDECDEVPD